MVLDERSRHELYLRLEQVLGAEPAQTLMEHLPPTGWADVATKRDLDQLAAVTKSDLDHLAAVTKSDLDQLAAVTKSDLDHLAAVTKSDLDQLAAITKRDLEALEHKMIGALQGELAAQTRTVVFAVLGSVLGSTSLSLLAARLAA